MYRFVRFVVAALATLIFACGDGGGPKPGAGTARFSSMRSAERSAAVSAAAGDTTALAVATLFVADIDAQFGQCPTRVGRADALVYDAGEGCTTNGGTSYAGRIEAQNAPILEGSDPTRPMRLTFQGFRSTGDDAAIRLDGTIVQSAQITGAPTRTASHLTSDSGIAAHIALATDCLDDGDARSCTIVEGGHGEIAGQGTFAVRGRIDTVENGYGGWIELQGHELLRVELAPGRACNPVTIDGKPAGDLCREGAEQSTGSR